MSRHAFFDPTHPHEKLVLVTQPAWTGVEHPDCTIPATVSPQLDAYYCPACGYKGRISGAWFIDAVRHSAVWDAQEAPGLTGGET